jgi:hypothetical protein
MPDEKPHGSMLVVTNHSHYDANGGTGTQLVYTSDGVRMCARFPMQISVEVAIQSIRTARRRLSGELQC